MSTAAPQKAQKEKIVKTFSDTNYFAKGTYKRDFVELFSTSALANYLTKTALAPLQRWRIVKQTQLAYQLRPLKIKSFTQYLTKFSKDQGWTSFWRGNSANCWLHFWQLFSQIFIFDSIKSTFHQYSFELRKDPVSKAIFERILAPILAASASLVITHPIDTSRVRLSMNYYRNPKQMLFTGITSCWSVIRLEQSKHVTILGSMKGIYRGYLLAVLIGVLHLNIYASFRDMWNNFNLLGDQKELGELIASKESIGTIFSLLLLHPLDTIKKNLQLNNQSRPMMFKTMFQVFSYYKQLYGIQSLYQGVTVGLVRQALFWPIFITSLNFLQKQVQKF